MPHIVKHKHDIGQVYLWWALKLKKHIFCGSDLRIAIKLTDNRESEFPPTTQNVLLILKFTIVCAVQSEPGKRCTHVYITTTSSFCVFCASSDSDKNIQPTKNPLFLSRWMPKWHSYRWFANPIILKILVQTIPKKLKIRNIH